MEWVKIKIRKLFYTNKYIHFYRFLKIEKWKKNYIIFLLKLLVIIILAQ